MLKFLGENYYLDIDEFERQVSLDKSAIQKPVVESESGDTEQQISLTRFETFKSLIEVILTEREELDEGLGLRAANDLTIPFKIAFNTLLINKIIKTL
jgi:hypothetical protein